MPQESAAVSANFCNESVYGNLNVLSVTGVVRLDPKTAPVVVDAPAVALDWPSRDARVRSALQARMGPEDY